MRKQTLPTLAVAYLMLTLVLWSSLRLYAADQITATVTVTNIPAHNLTFVVNGDTRTWKTNGTAITDIAIDTSLINGNTTNLFDHIVSNPFTGPIHPRLNSTNSIKLTASSGQALSITMSNQYGFVTYTTNAATASDGIRTLSNQLIYGNKTFVEAINNTSNLHLGSVTHFIESDGYTQLSHAAINTNSVWRYQRNDVFPHLLLMDPNGNMDFNVAPTGGVNNAITFITPLQLKPAGNVLLSTGTDGSVSDSIQVGDRVGNADIAIFRNAGGGGANGSIKFYATGSGSKAVEAQIKFEQPAASVAADIVLMTHNGTALAERARLKSTGRFGLQTNAPAATLHVYGSSIFGTNGTVILDRISDNFTFDPPSISAAAQFTTNVTMTGATIGGDVQVTPSTAAMGGITYDGYISGANTVTIRLNNYTAGAVDPTNQAHRVTVVTYP